MDRLFSVTARWKPYASYSEGSDILVGSYVFRATYSFTTGNLEPTWNFDIGSYPGAFRNMGVVGGQRQESSQLLATEC
jgi:hypothetical protein